MISVRHLSPTIQSVSCDLQHGRWQGDAASGCKVLERQKLVPLEYLDRDVAARPRTLNVRGCHWGG